MSQKIMMIGEFLVTNKVEEIEKKIISAASCQKCPVSGVWKIIGPITSTQTISKGDPMPEYCGKKVKWQLLYPI